VSADALYLRTPLPAIAELLQRRRLLLPALLLGPPLLWFCGVYLGSLLSLLWQGFHGFDDFSMRVLPTLTLANYGKIFDHANFEIVLRTLAMACAVTVAAAAIAFPIAYYMARHASRALKGLFYVGVMLPMWASYIVKAYSWTVILAKGGILYWALGKLHLAGAMDALLTLPVVGGSTLSTSNLGRFLVFTYLWLPFMILPIQAALERVPPNLLQASADLGAKAAQTFRHVTWPLAFPGVVAGSIFTFSLTLGDYITPQIVSSTQFIGNVVYTNVGVANNLPLAAAFATVPVLIMILYLLAARRLGAFESL
jgi:putative spermidine/putrescine transport system permease protein